MTVLVVTRMVLVTRTVLVTTCLTDLALLRQARLPCDSCHTCMFVVQAVTRMDAKHGSHTLRDIQTDGETVKLTGPVTVTSEHKVILAVCLMLNARPAGCDENRCSGLKHSC